MAESLRAKLPSIYAHLFSDVFDQPSVVETRATCDDCAMCDKGEPTPVPMDYFRPDTKCCTYHPFLPNFLVGAILADTGPELEEGRRRLREKIASRISVTPRWIAPPRKYGVLMEAARAAGFFGRTKAALCPYFDSADGGRCTVWAYRDNICSTYFCKYTSGKLGWEFWSALKEYLSHVEKVLSRYAAVAVDPEANVSQIQQPGKLTIEDLEDRGPKDAEYAAAWGKWVGREEEFYIACHERVKAMTREEFATQVDGLDSGQKVLKALRQAYATVTSPVLPSSLVRNPKMRQRHVGDNVVVTSYSTIDALALDKDLFEVLGTLRSEESLEANLARLAADGIELAPELLHYLFAHGILVAPAAAASAVCAT